MILPFITKFLTNKTKPKTLEDNNHNIIETSPEKIQAKKELENILEIITRKLSYINSNEFKLLIENDRTVPDFIMNFCSELNMWYINNKENLTEDTKKYLSKIL